MFRLYQQTLLLGVILSLSLFNPLLAQEPEKQEARFVLPAEHSKDEPNVIQLANGKEFNFNTFDELKTKDRYEIDLLIPLKLNEYFHNDQLGNRPISSSVKSLLDFYKGVRIAAEELNTEAVPLDLRVVTVDTTGINFKRFIQDSLSSKPQPDVYIGLFQSAQIKEFADFALENKVNFLSALSPSDGDVSKNPYFILMQPNLETHLKNLLDFATNNLFRNNLPLFIVSSETPIDENARDIILANLPDHSFNQLKLKDFLANPESAYPYLDSTRSNVIISNILPPKEVDTFLKRVNELAQEFPITVLGTPTWNFINDIAQNGTFPGVHFYFTQAFHFDPLSAKGQDLVSVYKNKYENAPGEMVYRGYELVYWIAHLMDDHGVPVNANWLDTRWTPFTKFKIEKDWQNNKTFNYWENKHTTILHYFNGYSNVEQ